VADGDDVHAGGGGGHLLVCVAVVATARDALPGEGVEGPKSVPAGGSASSRVHESAHSSGGGSSSAHRSAGGSSGGTRRSNDGSIGATKGP